MHGPKNACNGFNWAGADFEVREIGLFIASRVEVGVEANTIRARGQSLAVKRNCVHWGAGCASAFKQFMRNCFCGGIIRNTRRISVSDCEVVFCKNTVFILTGNFWPALPITVVTIFISRARYLMYFALRPWSLVMILLHPQ